MIYQPHVVGIQMTANCCHGIACNALYELHAKICFTKLVDLMRVEYHQDLGSNREGARFSVD